MSSLKAQVIFLQILHQSSVPSNLTPLYFFSSNIIYFGRKQPIKVQIFEIFRVLWSKSSKFLMSILNWKVNSSSNLASFVIAMAHKSPINFKVIHFLLWIKRFHQSLNFENFECSDENLPNSSSHFSNHNSVFLQILHHYPVSWNITPL